MLGQQHHNETSTPGSTPRTWLVGGILALAFAVVHTQSPLFYSNQNQYFLHGAARAHIGDLHKDWLANTADPTPLFTRGVAFSFQSLGTWPFTVTQFAMCLLNFLALYWLMKQRQNGTPLLASLILMAVYSACVRAASVWLLGADYPWFLQCGLASQYVLGPGLQPSTIGVLVLVALAAYQSRRTLLAVALTAGVNLVHSTYLLPSALLVAGFITAELVVKRWQRAIGMAALALGIVAYPVWYTVNTFATTEPEAFQEAQQLLAEVRIPHHAVPARWFDWIAGLQVFWMMLGLWTCRQTSLFIPLVVASGLAALGTGVVLLTNNPTLALLFPWRHSAVLMPASTALILQAWCRRVPVRASRTIEWTVIVVFLLICGTVPVHMWQLGYAEPAAEDAVLEQVRTHRQPGEVYLIPARFSKPTTVRGVYSNTFAKPPDPDKPVFFELARFRLSTGAALYIDFKSIPYKADEVLEWQRRIWNCERWYADAHWDDRGVLAELRAEGISHVIVPKSLRLKAKGLELQFEGGAYQLFRLN